MAEKSRPVLKNIKKKGISLDDKDELLAIDLKKKEELINRAGQFSINIQGGRTFNDPKVRGELRKLMETVIIISATRLATFDQIHYIALSEQFRPINPNDKVPGYQPYFHLDENNEIIKVEWREVQ